MEAVKSGSLRRLMNKRKAFTDEDASKVIRSLLSAVEHVHSKNYVHRDLKPDNILIDNEHDVSTVKLADFGLSASFRLNVAYTLNEKMGTLLFMAPEQTKNYSYGKKIDMWSCGIIMYMLIEGKHPFFEPNVDTEKSYLNKLKNPQWVFSDKFSPLAKDLFVKLCNTSPIERYTSDKALKHPWITRQFNGPIPLT
jgi:serine/threonine protein kinase